METSTKNSHVQKTRIGPLIYNSDKTNLSQNDNIVRCEITEESSKFEQSSYVSYFAWSQKMRFMNKVIFCQWTYQQELFRTGLNFQIVKPLRKGIMKFLNLIQVILFH